MSPTTSKNGKAPALNSKEGRLARAAALKQKFGDDLFARYPRDRVRYLMDPRPLNWRETGWKSIATVEERVENCVLYHSLCGPVYMENAVLLDADDNIVLDRYGQPKPLRRERIATILNLGQSLVFDAVDSLVAKKRLNLDDGWLYFIPKPAITPDERKDLCTQIFLEGENADLPAKLFQRFDLKLQDLGADEDLRTQIFSRVREARTRFLGGLKDLRRQERDAYDEVSTALDILIVQRGTVPEPERTDASSSSEASVCHSRPASSIGDDDDDTRKQLHAPPPGGPTTDYPTTADRKAKSAEIAALHAAGFGKGALAALPRPRPQLPFDETARAVRSYTVADDQAILQLVVECVKVRPECVDAEIAFAVHQKAPQAKSSVLGFLQTALPALFRGAGYAQLKSLIAQEAQSHETPQETPEARREHIDNAWSIYRDTRESNHMRELAKEVLIGYGVWVESAGGES